NHCSTMIAGSAGGSAGVVWRSPKGNVQKTLLVGVVSCRTDIRVPVGQVTYERREGLRSGACDRRRPARALRAPPEPVRCEHDLSVPDHLLSASLVDWCRVVLRTRNRRATRRGR